MSDLKETVTINKDDTVTIAHQQDVTGILESAKELRENQPGSKKNIGKMKDNHLVCRIPDIVIQKLINEGQIHKNYISDKHQLAKLYAIIRRDYPEFMATERNIDMYKGG